MISKLICRAGGFDIFAGSDLVARRNLAKNFLEDYH
jgi:hypothetical protein